MQDIQTARYALLFGAVLVLAVSIAQCEGDTRPAPAAAQMPYSDDPPHSIAELDEVKEEARILAAYYINEHGHPHPYRLPGGAHGFELDDDMTAINAVLERIARIRQHGFIEAAHAYSHGPVLDPESCTGIGFPWDGSEPRCWHVRWPTLSWARRRQGWNLVWRHAIDVRLGLVHDRCEQQPLHWGCGVEQSTPPRGHGHCRDHERAARQGWCEVDCGTTHVTLYAACGGED